MRVLIYQASTFLRSYFNSFSKNCMYKASTTTAMNNVRVVESGCPNTLDYRIYYESETGVPISPWHDIPIFADESQRIYNMVCEIPRWTNAKMEIATAERLNPIKQDIKKGQLRFVNNVFPHRGYIWNYGAIPQTWENPKHIDPETGAVGDNDPIDICEIGHRVCERGEIIQVKVLGTLALIDEGETDWKLIAISIRDPMAAQLNDITDVDKLMPGYLKATHEWFRFYKVPTGKPENAFAFNGQYKNKEFSERVIDQTHDFWTENIGAVDSGELDWSNVSIEGSPHKITLEAAQLAVQNKLPHGPEQSVDSTVDKWHFVVT